MIFNESHVICVADAIKELRPNAVYELCNTTFTKWYDPDGLPEPSWEEVEKVIHKQTLRHQKEKYARERIKDYLPVTEQLDMIWHAIDQGIYLKNSEWFYHIKHVKQKYPKV